MDRNLAINLISKALGRRDLVWAGIRGDDADSLGDLPQFCGSYCIIGAYRSRSTVESIAYEDLSGERPDLETWDIDDHLDSPATASFRGALLSRLGSQSALVPYRPSRFLSSIAFARRDRCVSLGMFGALQFAFEHKPWVESSLAGIGVPTVPWVYVAEEEQHVARVALRRGPIVVRRSRTSGGEGIALVHDADELERFWPRGPEAFVSVAPYLDGALPINVGATVWGDQVTVHHASVQLIGIPSCVGRTFGYCGNDFVAARDLDPRHIDQIESSTRIIGGWLARHGYLGTFGVDYLLHDDKVLFTEINPRFQGSTHASSQLAIEAGEACLYLEHIAAWLGVPPPQQQKPLRDLVMDAAPLAHIVVHRTDANHTPVDVTPLIDEIASATEGSRADVIAAKGTRIAPGAAMARLTVRRRVTATGFELLEPLETIITGWKTMTSVQKEEARSE